MELVSINPASGEVIKKYDALSDVALREKLNRSQLAFKEWNNTGLGQRKQLLCRIADILVKRKEDLAKLIHDEMGKVLPEAIAEVEKCAWVCRYYADNGEVFLETTQLDVEGKEVNVFYQPLGAVLAIMPWNFPFWQVFRFAAPALMAGNVGLLKHAPNVCGCALAIEELFATCEAPEGVFQTLLLDVEQVEEVIASPVVKAVTLTGSVRAGGAVASLAGKYLKKTVLELGGSDPFIVLEDANLDLAIETAILARMRNAGQSCIAAKRFIVVDAIYDQFVDRFKTAMLELKKDEDYGPMARLDLAIELSRQLNESLAKGAKLVCGGKRVRGYFEPTIISKVVPGMPAYEEELFGPVASVISVSSIAEAIDVANDTNFGLGASIWTTNVERARQMALKIEAGSVFVNQLVASDPRIPFGGIKHSGYGRELSLWGIREFVNVKPIVV